MTIFLNIHFWMIIAFLIMLILFAKKIYMAFLNQIQSNINKIKTELDDVIDIYNNSVSILNDKKKYLTLFEKDSEQILSSTRHACDIYYEKSIAQINNKINNNKKSFESYLQLSKEKYIMNLNNTIIDEAVASCEEIAMDQSLDEQISLIDISLDNIKKSLLNNK